jgi:hypothetical protein
MRLCLLSALVAASVCAAGCENLPEVLPPGFTETSVNLGQVQLDFPTGIAVTPDKAVLLANGNFSHSHNGGVLVGFSPAFIQNAFLQNAGLNCQDLNACVVTPQFASAVMIGNYAGPVALNDLGTVAYAGSRDSNTLNAVSVGPGGALSCFPGAGVTPDCRPGLLTHDPSGTRSGQNLDTVVQLDGPYAIVPGDASSPGQPSKRVMWVASLVPFINSILDGTPITSSQIAAIDQSNPSQILFSMEASSQYIANGIGIGPILYDPVRRRIVASGCYQRFPTGASAGSPGSGKCFNAVTNYLRMLNVDSGNLPQVELFDMHPDVQSVDTSDMVFADFDSATGAPTTIWALMRFPDVLVKINLPLSPAIAPRVQQIIPMPAVPGTLVRIPRPGKGDLLAITSEVTGALVIYDVDAEAVVANVTELGDSPSTVKIYQDTGTSAQLVVGVFGACRMALVEVPYADPSQAALRARIGGCEE